MPSRGTARSTLSAARRTKDLRARGLVRARGCVLRTGFGFAPLAIAFFAAGFLDRLTLAAVFLTGLRGLNLRAMKRLRKGFVAKANETLLSQQDADRRIQSLLLKDRYVGTE